MNKTDKKNQVKVKYVGGNGLQDAYRILAKKVIEKLQEKEQVNASSDLHQSEY